MLTKYVVYNYPVKIQLISLCDNRSMKKHNYIKSPIIQM